MFKDLDYHIFIYTETSTTILIYLIVLVIWEKSFKPL